MMFELRRKLRLSRILHVSLLIALASAGMAQGFTSTRYPISGADIAKALSVDGVDLDAAQIHLPMHMSAAIESPDLEIATAEAEGDNQVRVEMRCSTAIQCLPFFATLDIKDADIVSKLLRSQSRSSTDVTQKTLQIGAGPKTQPQLRVGSRAVLILKDGHLDIHLQVLAIDSGATGQQVRVCTLDRKKVFHATVTGEGIVTGVME